MTTTINLHNDGTAELNEEFITIHDKKQRRSGRIMMLSAAIWSVAGPLFLMKEEIRADNLMMWLWLGITAVHIVLFLLALRQTWKETIWLDEVKSASMKSNFNHYVLTLKLRGGRVRKIYASKEELAALRSFAAANFPE